jgi:2,4-dienoyl-CoA reductase-like NADH-dependent reductase (Old Yellow Enzyme family)
MSGQKYPKLFEPGAIAGIELPNRFVVAPMARISADENGVPGALMRDYYAAYADGGFGLIIAEGTYTDVASSQCFPTQPGIATEAQIDGWRAVTGAVHESGGRIFLQLMHAGALLADNTYGAPPLAPSAVLPDGEKSPRFGGSGAYAVPLELTRDAIEIIVDSHVSAAENAARAGFDGVEVHNANGYLLDQFLTDYTNRRDDEYGGALENRLRLPTEVMAAVKDAIGEAAVAGVRISQTKVNDFDHQWAGGADDARTIFSALAGAGADYIHLATRRGGAEVFASGRSLAGLARDYTGLPVIACGALHEPDAALDVLGRGEADFIAIAKGAIADPALPNKIAAGEAPVPFVPEMLMPLATIESTRIWRAGNAAG